MKHAVHRTENEALNALITAARADERKDRAQAVAARLAAMATHISRQGLNGIEAAELIRHEAQRYRDESEELH
jgi:hypothetical protein